MIILFFSFFNSCFYLLFQLLCRALRTSNQRSQIVSCCVCGGVHGASVLLSSSSACSCCKDESSTAGGGGGGGSTFCSQPPLGARVFCSCVKLCSGGRTYMRSPLGSVIFLPSAACVETVLLNVGLGDAPLLLCDVTPARCPLTTPFSPPQPSCMAQRRRNIQPLAPGTHISFHFLFFCCFNEMQGDVGFFFFPFV